MNLLASVRRVTIDRETVRSTLSALQQAGSGGCECLVLWLGGIATDRAIVTAAFIPEQRAIKSEDGVGYFVSGDALFRLNQTLSESGLRLIAQVHSHPSEAYHSAADDRYAIVTAEGGLSLVVPDFGDAPSEPAEWAVYRLRQGVWEELSRKAARQLLEVTDVND